MSGNSLGTTPPPAPPPSDEAELTAYGKLTEGVDDAALQDPEIRALLTDRSKDLADIMRGESAEQVVNGRTYFHVMNRATDQVGWVSAEDYQADAGAYLRADKDTVSRQRVASAILAQTAGDIQEQLTTLSPMETYAVSTMATATLGEGLEWFGDDLARARFAASRDASPTAAMAGDLNAAISTSIIGGAAIGGIAAGASAAAGAVGAGAFPSGILGYGAVNLLSRGRQVQSFLAARAAAAGVSPAVSGAAIAAGRSASTLATEGALGEMQLAYAQAAIDQRELSSEEIWSTAGTGAMWGLGAYGVGTAMKFGYNVSAKLAKRKLDVRVLSFQALEVNLSEARQRADICQGIAMGRISLRVPQHRKHTGCAL